MFSTVLVDFYLFQRSWNKSLQSTLPQRYAIYCVSNGCIHPTTTINWIDPTHSSFGKIPTELSKRPMISVQGDSLSIDPFFWRRVIVIVIVPPAGGRRSSLSCRALIWRRRFLYDCCEARYCGKPNSSTLCSIHCSFRQLSSQPVVGRRDDLFAPSVTGGPPPGDWLWLGPGPGPGLGLGLGSKVTNKMLWRAGARTDSHCCPREIYSRRFSDLLDGVQFRVPSTAPRWPIERGDANIIGQIPF